MFSKSIAFILFAVFAILAVAAPDTSTVASVPAPTATTISQCNTGNAQCCTVTGVASSLPGLGLLTGLLGIVLQDLSAVVGLGCLPITVGGLGQGANCAQQPVCCSNNSFGGILSIACNPISL